MAAHPPGEKGLSYAVGIQVACTQGKDAVDASILPSSQAALIYVQHAE